MNYTSLSSALIPLGVVAITVIVMFTILFTIAIIVTEYILYVKRRNPKPSKEVLDLFESAWSDKSSFEKRKGGEDETPSNDA